MILRNTLFRKFSDLFFGNIFHLTGIIFFILIFFSNFCFSLPNDLGLKSYLPKTLFINQVIYINHAAVFAKRNSYEFADSVALSIKNNPELSVQKIAQTICGVIFIDSSKHIYKKSTVDSLRLRAYCRWICENIEYDVISYKTGRYKELNGDAVIKYRSAVCQGFAQLLKELCIASNIECHIILGFGKGANYRLGQKIYKVTGHAWNCIKIGEKYYLSDITWAAGSFTQSGYKKEFNPTHLNADPKLFIYDHYPQDPKWQLLKIPVSLGFFEEMPRVIFSVPFKPISPLEGQLNPGTSYKFVIHSNEAESAILLVGEDTKLMNQEFKDGQPTGVFYIESFPIGKQVHIGIHSKGSTENEYKMVITYGVKSKYKTK